MALALARSGMAFPNAAFQNTQCTATHSTLSPLYMAEISPPEVRGSLLALEQFSIVLGCVLGFWTGFLTRNSKSDSLRVLVRELRSLL